jgi:hypothetical protein
MDGQQSPALEPLLAELQRLQLLQLTAYTAGTSDRRRSGDITQRKPEFQSTFEHVNGAAPASRTARGVNGAPGESSHNDRPWFTPLKRSTAVGAQFAPQHSERTKYNRVSQCGRLIIRVSKERRRRTFKPPSPPSTFCQATGNEGGNHRRRLRDENMRGKVQKKNGRIVFVCGFQATAITGRKANARTYRAVAKAAQMSQPYAQDRPAIN